MGIISFLSLILSKEASVNLRSRFNPAISVALLSKSTPKILFLIISDFLVIGRAITGQENMIEAAKKIVEELPLS